MIRIDDYLFIKGYEETAEKIIAQLKEYTKLKEPNFSAYIDGELRKTHLNLSFFAEDKLTLLRSLFCNSRVAFVDGAAGTGKSVFISLVVSVMNNLNPIVLSKTNASAENLKQKIGNFSQSILTLDTFFKIYGSFHSSLCVVDECSTISNDDMIKLLDILNANNTFLLLVGDEHQIESIHFGNWFVLAKKGFSGNCHTLEIIFRAKGKTELQKLWTSCRVDKEKEKVLTLLGHGDYTRPVSDFGFEKICEDDVILCLNYDGLYGINNINRIMQANNKGKSFRFRDSEFRIGDPVIFSKSRRLEPFVYNGMHGTIKDINIVDGGLSFDIAVLSSMSIPVGSEKNQGFEYLGDKGSGIPLIRIKVVEKWDQDGDLNDASLSYLPFEVAYAVSIHKAQGLEYKNVRIIVTDNVAELITPNIFYTAITRTTDQLKIYWSPSSALSITKRLTENNGYEKDIDIFKSKFHFLF
jgi:ATP-dependent exoDNAse (exonuclease V) alpha subunit